MLSGLKNNLVNVGFRTNFCASWTGGKNYLRNLILAIDSIENRCINPYIFVGTEYDEAMVQSVREHATVVVSPIFNKVHSSFPLEKRIKKWFQLYLTLRKIRSLKIQVMSHSAIYGDGFPFLKLNWIPDFQHIHLPNMFSEEECAERTRKFKEMIQGSDTIVFSSNDAINDARCFLPGYETKYKKLSFVSVPEGQYSDKFNSNFKQIKKKYSISGNFFYMPNQFWKHKNHRVVFEAIHQLKKSGIEILLLCTGALNDYRHKDYVEGLTEYICQCQLKQNIRLLGVIPYEDVFSFMRNARAIINPSLFEGWSSTVEEAKSLGQQLILSDIPVHREQNPARVSFFDPNSPDELATVLKKNLEESQDNSDFFIEAKKQLAKRVKEYGETYQDIILNMVGQQAK